jgi:acetoin utilization protein AcuB
MNVRDAMVKQPMTVGPETTIEDAEATMRKGKFRHLPVARDGLLVGIVTERDLHGAEFGRDEWERGRRPVKSVMTTRVITISPGDPLESAAQLMLENKIGGLPVVEGERLVGIITQSDIFRAYVETMGVMAPGTRVQIRAADLTTAVEQIAAVAKSRGVRIISIVSEIGPEPGESGVVVRFGTVMLGQLTAALRAAGLTVVEPDAGPIASPESRV